MVYEDITTQFDGGISLSTKTSLPNSARFTRNLAIYEDSDSVTLTPKPILDNTTTGLVKWIIDTNPYENARYAYDDAGHIYRIASNAWTDEHTIASGSPAGQGAVQLFDALYYATSTTIGRKALLSSGSGTYTDDFFSDGTQNIDANVTAAAANTYTIPAAISETSANKITYTPAYDTLTAIQLFQVGVGTGTWTITVHDSQNNTIGSVAITPNSGNNGTMIVITFTTPLRLVIGASYHFHITQAAATGTIRVGTSSDLSTAQYKTQFGVLIGDSDYHPMIQHTNGVTGIFVVGNDHYLGTYDGVTYNPNKIALEPGYKVRSLMKINEYVAAFCWKGSNIDSFEYGRVYYWDGIQPYFNFSRELTQGMPNSVVGFKNRQFGIFGSSGQLEIAPDESSPFRRLQPAPKLTIGAKVEVLPGAMGVWQNRALFGYSNTDDANAGAYNDPSKGIHVSGDTYTPPAGLEQGVYEFGNQSDRAISYSAVSTEVLNFAFLPSTPIANPLSFKIGCVEPFGKDCYISYKDGATYYVDRVTKGNVPASFGSWESLIADETFTKYKQLMQQPQKYKRGLKVVVTCQALPTGCTVTAKYRADRSSAWIFGASAIAGAASAVVTIGGLGGKNYKEMEYGFDVTASSTGYPYMTSIGLFLEPLDTETSETTL